MNQVNHKTTSPSSKIHIALVDGHVLLRKGLAEYIRSFEEYDVLLEASDGQDFIRQLTPDQRPDMVFMNTSTPRPLGQDTARWINVHYPGVKIFALSVSVKAQVIVRADRDCVRRHTQRDRDPLDFRYALGDLLQKGFHYSDLLSGRELPGHDRHTPCGVRLNEREVEFLKLACSELTYKEIAERMYLSARTIDGYRDTLFDKLGVRTRVGMVIYAIKQGIAVV